MGSARRPLRGLGKSHTHQLSESDCELVLAVTHLAVRGCVSECVWLCVCVIVSAFSISFLLCDCFFVLISSFPYVYVSVCMYAHIYVGIRL